MFDSATLAKKIETEKLPQTTVRVWNQEAVIEWLKKEVEAGRAFRSKRILEEVEPRVTTGEKSLDPYPEGPDRYRFRDSPFSKKVTKKALKIHARRVKMLG